MAQRASELRASAAASSAASSSPSTATALGRTPYSGGGGGGGSHYGGHHGGGGGYSGGYGGGGYQDAGSTDGVFFGGVSALAEHLDRALLLVLRDGRLLFGTLASYDQYGSIVVENAKERLTAQGKFADIDMGMYMIRGENIMLMGELDAALDAANPHLVRAEREEVEELIAAEQRSGAVKGGVAGLTCVGGGGGQRVGAARTAGAPRVLSHTITHTLSFHLHCRWAFD
jgi:U6 snRNA-associated Sm-like protein LSm1